MARSELMPIDVPKVLTPARTVRPGSVPTLVGKRLEVPAQLCDRLGITFPPEVADLLERSNATRWRKFVDDDASASDIASALASGSITANAADKAATKLATVDTAAARKAQKRVARLAADQLYAEACRALVPHADDLIDRARQVLVDTLAAQLKERFEAPELQQTYEDCHALAAGLRWTAPSCVVQGTDWWRFQDPKAVWRWRLDEADRMIRTPRMTARIKAVNVAFHGVFLTPCGVPTPGVLQAALHPEWRPDLVSPAEVIATADRIEREQLPDQPPPGPQFQPSQPRGQFIGDAA